MFLRTVGTHFETRGGQVDELRESQFTRQITQDACLFSSQAYGSNIVHCPPARSQRFLLAQRYSRLIGNPLYLGRGQPVVFKVQCWNEMKYVLRHNYLLYFIISNWNKIKKIVVSDGVHILFHFNPLYALQVWSSVFCTRIFTLPHPALLYTINISTVITQRLYLQVPVITRVQWGLKTALWPRLYYVIG
jgi:hypothetical protein